MTHLIILHSQPHVTHSSLASEPFKGHNWAMNLQRCLLLSFALLVACEQTQSSPPTPTTATTDAWLDVVVARGRAELARGYNLDATGDEGPRAPTAEDPEESIPWVFRDTSGVELTRGFAPDTRELFVEGGDGESSDVGIADSSLLTVRVPDVEGDFEFFETTGERIAQLHYHPLLGRPFRADLGSGKADFSFETDLLGDTVRMNGVEGKQGITILLVPEGFTEGEMGNFHVATEEMVSGLLTVREYAKYRDSFHILRQDIRSKQSGLSDPATNQKRDTAFNVTFGDDQHIPRRCTMPSDDWNATSAANLRTLRERTLADVVVVVTNTTEHSGCARWHEQLIVQPGGRTGRILAHELGHALFGLGDEYVEQGQNCRSDYPNLTTTTVRANIPWSDLILPSTRLPTMDFNSGVVGAFEGGGYCSTGVYRPAYRCMMNNLNDDMCPVCARELTRTFDRRIAAITQVEITNRTRWKLYLLCGAEIGGTCSRWISLAPGASHSMKLQDGSFRLSGPPWGERVFVAPSARFTIYENEDPFTPPGDASLDGGLTDAAVPDASTDSSVGDASAMDAGLDGSVDGECALVISEVQTGGASADDEFVELFNPCATPISLEGMTLVYRSRSSNSNTHLLMLKGTLAGGSHFVAAGRGFSGASQGLLASGLSATGGAVALLRNGERIDSVAWGNATNAFVESSPANAPQQRGSIARIPDGQDTQNNARDFVQRSTSTPGSRNL